MSEIGKTGPLEEKKDLKIDGAKPAETKKPTAPVAKAAREISQEKKGCLRFTGYLLLIIVLIFLGKQVLSVSGCSFMRKLPIAGNIILKSASYTGTADDENATMTMKMEYESFDRWGWKKIPILPVTVAVSDVKLNGRQVYLNAGSQWYEVITKRRGKGTIDATFSMKVRESEGVRRLMFHVPRTTATNAEIQLDGRELDVIVDNAQHRELASEGGKTTVKVTYPPVDAISMSWQRAKPELAEQDARLYSETDTVCSILEGLLHCNTVVRYSILRSWINGLKVSIPDDVNVLAVTGARIRDWTVIGSGDKRTLNVEFSYKVQGNYELTIVYEKAVNIDGQALMIPALSSVGVEREKGYIGVEALSNVQVTTDSTKDIMVVGVDELPASLRTMTTRPMILGYKYVEHPYSLSLKVKRHEDMSLLSMIADSALHTVMMTSDGRRLTRVFYSLRNNGNQFMTLTLPGGSELWGATIAGKTVNVMQGDEGKLLIPLMDATRGSGYVGVEVIYAEEGTKPDPKTGAGETVVELPSLIDTPMIHLMCELYLPKEGKYREKDFYSDAKMVQQFSSMRVAGTAEYAAPEKATREMMQMAQQRFVDEVSAGGGTPVSIKLPLDGQLFRFEKTLVLEENVKIRFRYTGLGKGSGGKGW